MELLQLLGSFDGWRLLMLGFGIGVFFRSAIKDDKFWSIWNFLSMSTAALFIVIAVRG